MKCPFCDCEHQSPTEIRNEIMQPIIDAARGIPQEKQTVWVYEGDEEREFYRIIAERIP